MEKEYSSFNSLCSLGPRITQMAQGQTGVNSTVNQIVQGQNVYFTKLFKNKYNNIILMPDDFADKLRPFSINI